MQSQSLADVGDRLRTTRRGKVLEDADPAVQGLRLGAAPSSSATVAVLSLVSVISLSVNPGSNADTAPAGDWAGAVT